MFLKFLGIQTLKLHEFFKMATLQTSLIFLGKANLTYLLRAGTLSLSSGVSSLTVPYRNYFIRT